jgi:hypothetical protein
MTLEPLPTLIEADVPAAERLHGDLAQHQYAPFLQLRFALHGGLAVAALPAGEYGKESKYEACAANIHWR